MEVRGGVEGEGVARGRVVVGVDQSERKYEREKVE